MVIMSKLNPIPDDVVIGLKDKVCLSDHYHICIEIVCKPLTTCDKVILQRRNMDNLQSQTFIDQLLSLNLFDKVNCSNVNDAVKTYNTSLSGLFNESCPLREIQVKIT